MPPNEVGPRDTTPEGTDTTTSTPAPIKASSRLDNSPRACLDGAAALRRRRGIAPIPAVGAVPDAATVFVGTLLWSAPGDATRVLELVADDDIESPALSVLVATSRRLAAAGKPHDAQTLMDELHRGGTVRRDVALALMDATTAGAVPEAAQYYGAAVVSAALRRRVESAGHALMSAADTAAEADLAPLVARAAAAITDCAARLAKLRGEA